MWLHKLARKKVRWNLSFNTQPHAPKKKRKNLTEAQRSSKTVVEIILSFQLVARLVTKIVLLVISQEPMLKLLALRMKRLLK